MAAVSSLVDSNSLTNSLLYLQNALKSVYLLVYLLKFEDKHQSLTTIFPSSRKVCSLRVGALKRFKARNYTLCVVRKTHVVILGLSPFAISCSLAVCFDHVSKHNS